VLRVLHLAAGNRWTGAAAPAFAEVEALRGAGAEAHYAYVGGYKLEAKIGHLDFTHPLIERAQNPLSFFRTVRALRRFIVERGIDVVHAHLTYDHALARVAVRGTKATLARTFHARRALRSDPYTTWLLARTRRLFVINETFTKVLSRAVFTPPPVDLRQFTPEGANVRAAYGIGDDETLITVIGKLSKDRGFEEALKTFALLVTRYSLLARLMIIGHGEHRPALEALAAELNVAPIWAGYHETDLAEHYRASDLLLFTARGSDEGHRAVLEAMACGVPVAAYPIDGIHALLGDPALVASQPTPAALAATARAAIEAGASLRPRVIERSLAFGYGPAAEKLLAGYV